MAIAAAKAGIPAVVVAVLRATEPTAMEPSETETARLVAVTVAATVAVEAARALCPKTIAKTATAKTPPTRSFKRKFLTDEYI